MTLKCKISACLFFPMLAALSVLGAVKVKDLGRVELEEKRKIADAAWRQALGGDNIGAGREIDSVVAVAGLLRDAGDLAGAREYFRRATIIAPLRVDARLSYARLCAKAGDAAAAKDAYKIVLAQAESDEALEESAAFLGVQVCEKMPAFATAPDAMTTGDERREIRLCLVTVPGGEQWLANALGARLRQLLKINVYVEQRDFVPAQPDRGGVHAYATELRERLPWQDLQFSVWAAKQGVSDKDSATDEQLIALVRKKLEETKGDAAAEDFDKAVGLVARSSSQWLADKLFGGLMITTKLRAGPRTLYVALLPQDIYANGSNFMFGSAQIGGDYAVVSYHRFMAEFTGETPKRERLVTRACKQMLSSIGHMLNVPRSADPMCARAYAASVEEQDAKGDKLCDQCRAGFAKALGHELGE